MVSDCLIEGKQWNVEFLNDLLPPDFLNDLLPPDFVSDILRIFIPSSACCDNIVWRLNLDGLYSIKSGGLNFFRIWIIPALKRWILIGFGN